MSRKLVLVIVLMFVLISMSGVAVRVPRVKASGTIYIRADGSIDPSTANITSVDNITYTFTDNINDEIEIERDNIVVDGAGYMLHAAALGYGDGILLSGRNNVTIRNMEIRDFSNGVSLYWSSNISISGNNITYNKVHGVYIYRSPNNSISGNKIERSEHGIRISQSSNNSISGNRMTKNYRVGWWSNGILVESSSNTSIYGNNITDSYNGVMLSSCNDTRIYGNNVTGNTDYGVYLMGSSDAFLHDNLLEGNGYGFGVGGWEPSHYLHSIDASNLVNGKPVYYLINQHGITVNPSTHPEVGFLALINSTNIIVEGLNLTENTQGLLIAYTNNTKIRNSNITNNNYGIYFYKSSNNSISENNITNNDTGIYLYESSNNNTISENTIATNINYAIDLDGSSNNNIISGNNITANKDYGILLDTSSNNVISGNDITNNEEGIDLSDASNNTVAGNQIANNGYGMAVYYSSNNTIYHNNFVNNTNQVYIYDSRTLNVWDDGVEGNYWSNYTGVDSNHDGIGDTVHVIGTNNTDRYPLMGMFHSFNTSVGLYVNVISNSTIENFQYFESNSTIKMYVSNMTLNQTFGFCRVCIPKNLMSPPYTVIINDGSTEVLYFNATTYDNNTHRWIYFAYQHSTHKVDIIPEFPTWTPILLILVVLTVATAIYKRKLLKTPTH